MKNVTPVTNSENEGLHLHFKSCKALKQVYNRYNYPKTTISSLNKLTWDKRLARQPSKRSVNSFEKQICLYFQFHDRVYQDGIFFMDSKQWCSCQELNKQIFRNYLSLFLLEPPTFTLASGKARNQLGTPGGPKSFPRGAQIFWTISNIFKLCPTHFYRGPKFSRRGLAPLRPLCLRTCQWACTTEDPGWKAPVVIFRELHLVLLISIEITWKEPATPTQKLICLISFQTVPFVLSILEDNLVWDVIAALHWDIV